MKRDARLYDLIQILRDGKLHTAAELAARLGVSPRTIWRDMAMAAETGLPVTGSGLGTSCARRYAAADDADAGRVGRADPRLRHVEASGSRPRPRRPQPLGQGGDALPQAGLGKRIV